MAELPTSRAHSCFGLRLNGKSRDKVADVEVLERTFHALSFGKDRLDSETCRRALSSSLAEVAKDMLSYWVMRVQSEVAGETEKEEMPTWHKEEKGRATPPQQQRTSFEAAQQSQQEASPEEAGKIGARKSAQPQQQTSSKDAQLVQQEAFSQEAGKRSNKANDSHNGKLANKQKASELTKSLYAKQADKEPQPVAQASAQQPPQTSLKDAEAPRQEAGKIKPSTADDSQNGKLATKQKASDLTKSLYAKQADKEPQPVAQASAQQPLRTSLKDAEAPQQEAGKIGPSKADDSQTDKLANKQKASELTKSLYAKQADKEPQPVAQASAQQPPQTSLKDAEAPRQEAGKIKPSTADDSQNDKLATKQKASELTKSLYAKHADKEAQPAAHASAQPQQQTSSKDAHLARQQALPQDTGKIGENTQHSKAHKQEASELAKSLHANKEAQPAAHASAQPQHQTSSKDARLSQKEVSPQVAGKISAVATEKAGDSKRLDPQSGRKENEEEEEEQDHEVVTKQQWVDWFISAELDKQEQELLQDVLRAYSPEQPLSPEELIAVINKHGKKASDADKEKLKEWMEWVQDMYPQPQADSSQREASLDQQEASPQDAGKIRASKGDDSEKNKLAHKQEASELAKSSYTKQADKEALPAAHASAKPQQRTSSKDAQLARQKALPQDTGKIGENTQHSKAHKQEASELAKSLHANKEAQPAAHASAQPQQQTSSKDARLSQKEVSPQEAGKISAVATEKAGDSKRLDPQSGRKENEEEEEEQDHEVVTKQQWVDWFISAELDKQEQELLQDVLRAYSPEQPLSPEELIAVINKHGKKASDADKEKLKEWMEWVQDMYPQPQADSSKREASLDQQEASPQDAGKIRASKGDDSEKNKLAHKQEAAELAKSSYTKHAEKEAQPAAHASAQPQQRTSSKDAHLARQQAVPQEKGKDRAVASENAGDSKRSDLQGGSQREEEAAEEEEEEVFTKQQWVDWFISAELDKQEQELLQDVLRTYSPEQPLSPEELVAVIKKYGKKASDANKEKLKEWMEWVQEMD